MGYKICIPSYRRPNWRGLEWLLSVGVRRRDINLLLHDDRDFRDYQAAQNLSGIQIHVTGAKGLNDQNTWMMAEMYPETFIRMDDDLYGLFEMKKNKIILSQNLNQTIEKMDDTAERLECAMFGVTLVHNAFWGSKGTDYGIDKVLNASFIGFKKFKVVPGNFMHNSEWDTMLQCIGQRRGVLRFNHYSVYKERDLGSGGCVNSAYKNSADEWREIAEKHVVKIGIKKLKNFGA